MDKTKHGDGARLRELLALRDIPLAEFRQIMKDAGYQAEGTRRRFIDHKNKKIDKDDLCLICSLFGFTPEDFYLPPDYFKSKYSSAQDAPEPMFFCYNSRKEGVKDYRPFLENFDKVANDYLLTAKEELLVCDYVDKARGIGLKENAEFYYRQAASFFERLEKRIAEAPDLKYKRILQLPLGNKEERFEDALTLVLQGMSTAHFGHMCRCLHRYPKQCEFVVVRRPFRLHTYFLVDNRAALTEYHRYDANGIPTPDTLFVNLRDPQNDSAVGSVYMDACRNEFFRMLNSQFNAECKILESVLCGHVEDLERKLRQELADLEEKLDRLKTACVPGIAESGSKRQGGSNDLLGASEREKRGRWVEAERLVERSRQRHDNIAGKLRLMRKIYCDSL